MAAVVSGIVRDCVESHGRLPLGFPESRDCPGSLMQEFHEMTPTDLTESPPAQKEPLLTRTDLIAAALVGIGIITVTSILLVLLF